MLFVESTDGWIPRSSMTVSGLDVVTGGKVWESPELVGALRDITMVDSADGARWVFATSCGMHVTR